MHLIGPDFFPECFFCMTGEFRPGSFERNGDKWDPYPKETHAKGEDGKNGQ